LFFYFCTPQSRTWGNWETRHFEGVVPVRVWKFESSRAHSKKKGDSAKSRLSCF
jgi:hypothetical protein